MSDLGTKGFVTEKVYPANGQNVQDVAYELAKYLDNDKHLITQTMRTSDGYLVQCKGDASMEWTKYLGMDAAVSTRLSVEGNNLRVTVRAEKWVEKAGIAALGVFFAPLLVTSGVGAVRQYGLFADIFNFIGSYLGSDPVESSSTTPFSDVFADHGGEDGSVSSGRIVCPHCGAENRADARFCRKCGRPLEEKVRKVCPSCGSEVDPDDAFCPHCGKKLN